MTVSDSLIRISLKNNNNTSVVLEFFTPFIISSPTEFELLKQFGEYINQKNVNSTNTIVCAIGPIRKDDNKYILSVNSYKHFSINGLSLYEFKNKIDNIN